MKKNRIIISYLMIICIILSGCGLVPTQSQVEPDSIQSSSSEEPLSSSAPEPEATRPEDWPVVKMMLPTSHQQLGQIMAAVAEEQSVDLQVRLGGNQPQYTRELAEAILSDEPPDLYWLPDEQTARLLQALEITPMDLGGQEAEIALRTLAKMSPEISRVLDYEQVYALPLGTYAEGTLVNLPVLASLLGTKDLSLLQKDLKESSSEEWAILIEVMAAYLQKPFQTQITLGGQLYTTPRYRPEPASALRGVFALSTVNPGSYIQNSLGAVYAAGFMDPTDYLDTEVSAVLGVIEQPLHALYRQVELETRTMTGDEGPLTRGEGFTGRVTTAQAKDLFLNGRALFWKSDSREALRIEQENADLSGNLFLIPTKLPYEDDEIEVTNVFYGTASDGYLCLLESSAMQDTAGELLVQFYTDPQYIQRIEDELYLLPYTDIYPEKPLLASLEEAIGVGDTYILPLPQEVLVAQQNRIGEWVNLNLMEKAKWEEQDETDFMVAAQGALGAMVEEQQAEMALAE